MERHVTPSSRLAGMEDATAEHLAGREKHTKNELEVLNNEAQLAIFGDGGDNGQPDYEVKKLDDDGNVITEYKFKDDDPRRGLIDDVRSNPAYGKTQAERDKSVKKLEAEVQKLLDRGLEMAQVKTLLELRAREASSVAHEIGERVTNGQNPTTARRDVLDRYYGESKGASYGSKSYLFSTDEGFYTLTDSRGNEVRKKSKDLLRIEKMKKHGLMSVEEFDTFTPGGNTGDVDDTEPAVEPTTLEKMEAVEFTDDQKNAMEAANETAKKAREAYEDIKIRREGRAFNFKKGFRSKDMQAAYAKWMEAEQHAGAVVASAYADHGFNMNTEVRGGNPDRELMKTLKALGALTTIDAHTESIKAKIEETNDSLNKVTKKIAELYANFGAVKPGQKLEDLSRKEKLGMFTKKVVKAAGLVAVGAGTALVLSPVLSGLAGVGAAGAVAGFGISRVARGGLLAKIKKVSDSRLGVIRADEDRLAAREAIEANMTKDKVLNPSLQSGTDIFKKNSEKTVRKNQKRLLGGIALGAAGGALVEGYGDDVWNGVKAGPGKVSDAAEWTGDKISGAWDGFTDWFDNNSPSENVDSSTGGDYTPAPVSPGGNGLGVPGEGADSIADQIVESPGVGGEGQPNFVGNAEIADEQVNPGMGGVPGGSETLSEAGNSFTVEAGNGVQTEINDALETWGYGRNDQLSAQLLQEASVKFPEGLLANNSTGSGWNEMITAPGNNSWNPGVAEFLQQRAEEILSAEPTIPTAA